MRLPKRLRILQFGLELLERHRRHATDAGLPSLRVVFEVGSSGFLLRCESHHDLGLIELAVGPVLVNHVDIASVILWRPGFHENINVFLVRGPGWDALHVTVVLLQGRPFRATFGAGWILDRNVQTTDIGVTLGVVPGLLLRLSRLR